MIDAKCKHRQNIKMHISKADVVRSGAEEMLFAPKSVFGVLGAYHLPLHHRQKNVDVDVCMEKAGQREVTSQR